MTWALYVVHIHFKLISILLLYMCGTWCPKIALFMYCTCSRCVDRCLMNACILFLVLFLQKQNNQSPKPLTPKSHFTSSVLFKMLHFFSDPTFLPPVSETITFVDAGDTPFAAGLLVTKTIHCFHPEAKHNRWDLPLSARMKYWFL